MKSILKNLKGDKTIWTVVVLLGIVSFLPVYSASSNLAYGAYGTGNTLGFLIKHLAHIVVGFCIIYIVHKVKYTYFKAISMMAFPFIFILLLYTLLQGKTIGGANASRWIEIPFVGIGFQPSTLAFVVMMIYVATYLAKIKDTKEITFQSSFFRLWMPVLGVVALILPANFSTAALMFLMVLMLVFVGMYPLKYLLRIFFLGLIFLVTFVAAAKAFPSAFPNRVDTWISRVESFVSANPSDDDVYQIEKAKTAIATGGISGLGPGKSVQKNFLPQSSSDFIYAIIVEEYGLVGGLLIIGLYLLLFFRFIRGAIQAQSLFGTLLIIGLGVPIVFQAMVNIAVAVELFPTTGQTLPLISSGGSSIWMTCFAIGIVLNVSKKEEEIKQEELDRKERERILQKLIEKEQQIEKQEEQQQKLAVETLKNL